MAYKDYITITCKHCGVAKKTKRRTQKFCSKRCANLWRLANGTLHTITNTTHGQSGTPEHIVWKGMRRRCNNSNDKKYDRYGGRGIKVCERWYSFENFLADMGPRPTPKHEIDRIDNDGNYEPGNCRWATRSEQRQNMPDNVIWSYKGKSQCITAWARELGVRPGALFHRHQRKWPVERALTQPFRKMKKQAKNLSPPA